MDRFVRIENLIGEDAFKRLVSAKVIVIGAGGVGSYVCEALARSGIGAITVWDGDCVEISNINRQLEALGSTAGMSKADAMAERMRDISPAADIECIKRFYMAGEGFDFTPYDFVIDAIDDIDAKVDIAKACILQGVRIISAMGGANKIHNEGFRISDISDTHTCPLAKVMRKRLRAEGIEHLTVVFSGERPVKTGGLLGTMSYVPGTAGLIIAGHVIREIAGLD